MIKISSKTKLKEAKYLNQRVVVFLSGVLFNVLCVSSAFSQVLPSKNIQSKETSAICSDAFVSYEALRKKIVNKSLTQNDLKRFEAIFNCPGLYRKLYEKFSLFSKKDDLYRELYKAFILSEPNSDVLYAYLQKKFNYLIKRLRKLVNFKSVEK